MENITTVGTVSSLGKSLMVGADAVSETLRRQTVGGMVGGSIYGLVWGELSNMLNTVLGLEISDTPSFSDRMYGYMFRLMAINKFERELTLSTLSSGAYSGGNPDGLPVNALFPLYANVVSDYPAFVRGAASDELNGIDSTSKNIVDGNSERVEVENLYPDDLGIGTFTEKWQVDNRNSILHKTKSLFDKGKIQSLISRFGTNTDGQGDIDYNGKVGYSGIGSSRGRNLKRAKGDTEYLVNGYNNPYCRVWTHHHQYDAYSKTIRPFISQTITTSDTPEGTVTNTSTDSRHETMKKLHTWKNGMFDFNEGALSDGKDGVWGWKNENLEWNHSVLNQQDGMVNITPKYDENGSIHTKDCMFSIENLAWKDYNPFEFEKALSWEQRGPLGGRIMWFPPYGISFTENTSVNWNETTFIGRGENVYTYSNTTRSGTLNFMMLTDHPSITDYGTWWNDTENKIDDDVWNRFFAGCDSLDGSDPNSAMWFLKPTPMDYMFETKGAVVEEKINQLNNEDDVPSDATEDITFFTFFPNNYSGNTDKDVDFSIGYLLAGANAQMEYTNIGQWRTVPISYKNYMPDNQNDNIGYEMRTKGITDTSLTNNKIMGCKNATNANGKKYAGLNGWNGVTKYVVDTDKVWQYRIDGVYEVPLDSRSTAQQPFLDMKKIWENNYAQTLSGDSYKDTTGNKLNSDVNAIPDSLATDKTGMYSFAEVAYAIAAKQDLSIKDYLLNVLGGSSAVHNERMEHLSALLDNKIERIIVKGYANNQGYEQANQVLAKSRGNLIKEWLRNHLSCQEATIEEPKIEPVGTKDENSKDAKIYRCAKCTIRFKVDATKVSTKENGDFPSVPKETLNRMAKELGISKYKGMLTLANADLLDNELDKESEDIQPKQEPIDIKKEQPLKGKTTGTNKIRYDNEMFFYKKFRAENPFKFKALSDKLQYFNPAFHSMTPEGFNMRLTFLQQCTRQGDTISASDKNAKTASNMAFGRPPFCVLRLGDFYNQMIVIKSINITYDDDNALTWDLNDEGIGAQPMIAKVSMQFDFIGGGDLAGPVRRLQNAMTFNYYANTSLYDNRADRMYYDAEENLSTRMGGSGNDAPKMPEYDKDGNIVSKMGTYSVFNTISKDDTIEVAKKQKELRKHLTLATD